MIRFQNKIGFAVIPIILLLILIRFQLNQTKPLSTEIKVKESVFEIENLIPKSKYVEVHLRYQGKLFLWRNYHRRLEEFPLGGLLLVNGSLQPLPKNKNLKTFDYGAYLQQQGFSGLLKVNRAALIGQHRTILNKVRTQRLKLSQQIDSMDISAEARGIYKALFLGLRGEIDSEAKANFSTAGLMHLLAVSGLHLGIIYFLLESLCKLLPLGKKRRYWSSAIILIGIWTFCLISGAGASVVRAATMFSIVSISKLLHRRISTLRLIVVSAFLLLILSPRLGREAGFLLSYSAVVGIVYLVPIWSDYYLPQKMIPRYFLQLVYVSIAAQLFTAPLSLYYFGNFPTYFLLANLVMLPVISLTMYLGLLVLLLDGFGFANWMLEPYSVLLCFPQEFSAWIAKLPYANLQLQINGITSLLSALFLALLVFAPKAWRQKLAIIGASFLLVIGIHSILMKKEKGWELNIISSQELEFELQIENVRYRFGKPGYRQEEYITLKDLPYADEHLCLWADENLGYRLETANTSSLITEQGPREVEQSIKMIIYHGWSLKKEKSWRQWCQDRNLSFYSCREQGVILP